MVLKMENYTILLLFIFDMQTSIRVWCITIYKLINTKIIEFCSKSSKSLHIVILKGKEFHNLIADGKKDIYKVQKIIYKNTCV